MRKYVIVSVIFILIALDRFSKIYIGAALYKDEYIPLYGQYIWIQLSYNTWIAFSLPIEWILLKCITLLILLGIIFFYIKDEYQKSSRILDTGYAFILAWAISHAYERIFIWHVVDFIAVKYFAILNFADIFISVGAFFLVIAYGINKRTSGRTSNWLGS
jgi:lipoprotein signal peptidase